ncbi:MAG: tetratricopeptide repeat protein [Bdellovibrionales bacterium]|nr:tetratricopeptide repeat protein [Bdellovibrionales bacterium]
MQMSLSILLSVGVILFGVPSAFGAKPQPPKDDVLKNELVKQRQMLEELRNENLVLKELAKDQKARSENKAQKTQMMDNQALFNHKKGRYIKDYAKLSEKDLYAKVVGSYRSRDRASLEAALELMSKRYPASVHMDNALYLSAMSLVQSKSFTPAIGILEEVIQKYPKGNKRVSALFAKGVVYKRLNLLPQSRRVLSQVIKEYPGSPESQRATLELRLLSKNSK